MYVDEDVLRAARVFAARHDQRDSDVVETALRRYLGLDMLHQVWQRNAQLSDDDATAVAYEELAAHRRERSS